MVSAGTLFDKQAIQLRDNKGYEIHGMEMRVGLKKGARVTAHKSDKAFLFVDSKF